MNSVNNWYGIGHVGQNPVLRETGSGKAVLNLSIAIDRTHIEIDEHGNRIRQKSPDWIPITMWDDLARLNAKYLQAGSQIAVEGALRPRKYHDRHGVAHNGFEIVASNIVWLNNIKSNEELQTARNIRPEIPAC